MCTYLRFTFAFLLGVIIVFSIAAIPEILDAITDAKKAIDKYKMR